MSYSDLYLKERTKPSKILIAVALIAAVSGFIFYYTSDSAPTRASKNVLKKHEIVNISPHQGGIFWESEEADEGWILYGETAGKLNLFAFDTRDNQGKKEKRRLHYAEIKNLSPETTYYYKIISNNEVIVASNKEPFTLKTAPETGSSGLLTPAYGKVALKNGEAARNIMVLLTVPEAYPLLAITSNTGEWLIPLQYFVSSSKSTYIIATESTISQIKIFNETEQSLINTSLGKAHPLPQTTVLGENYTFTDETSVLSAQSQRKVASSDNGKYSVTLRFPKDRSVIPGTAPLIKGYGIPGKTVTVTINSKPSFKVSVQVDKKGEWTVPITRKFKPGKYTVSVLTENATRKKVTLARSYSLIKSGERVLGESTGTPSATLQPSPTSSAGSPTPTSVEATEMPTPTESLNNDPIEETPTPPPPVSGANEYIPYMMTGAGLIITGVGIMLLL